MVDAPCQGGDRGRIAGQAIGRTADSDLLLSVHRGRFPCLDFENVDGQYIAHIDAETSPSKFPAAR